MDFQNYWYLLLLLVLAGITVFLFLKKTIVFVLEFKYMLPAIIFSGAVFILFNNRLVETGILSFNENYILGKTFYKLPIEEWLFLIIISLFSFSVYLLVSVKMANVEKAEVFNAVSFVLLLAVAYLAWTSRQKLIPFFINFLLAIYLGYTLLRRKFSTHLVKFYVSYLIVAVVFFIARSILHSLPVVIYENQYTLGIRFVNVPVEEFGYIFLLMLINITIFEYLRNNQLY